MNDSENLPLPTYETSYGMTENEADLKYLQLAGGSLTGSLNLNADPLLNLEATPKQYVDNNIITDHKLLSNIGVNTHDQIDTTIQNITSDTNQSTFSGNLNVTGVIKSETLTEANALVSSSGNIVESNVTTEELASLENMDENIKLKLDIIDATLLTIDTKVDKSGDTMTGFLTLSGEPINNLHAATKQYVDNNIITDHKLLSNIGVNTHDQIDTTIQNITSDTNQSTFSSNLNVTGIIKSETLTESNALVSSSGNIVESNVTTEELASLENMDENIKLKLDTIDATLLTIDTKVDKSGDTMTGFLTLSGEPINNLHAATKQYVNLQVGSVSGGLLLVGEFNSTIPLPSLNDVSKGNFFVCTENFYTDPELGVETASGDLALVIIDGNKQYIKVNRQGSGITELEADLKYLQLTGGNMSGSINTVDTNITNAFSLVNRNYVDNNIITDHKLLSNIGVNTHDQIDSDIQLLSSTSTESTIAGNFAVSGTISSTNLTDGKTLVSNLGNVVESSITTDEINQLSGVNTDKTIQNQFNESSLEINELDARVDVLEDRSNLTNLYKCESNTSTTGYPISGNFKVNNALAINITEIYINEVDINDKPHPKIHIGDIIEVIHILNNQRNRWIVKAKNAHFFIIEYINGTEGTIDQNTDYTIFINPNGSVAHLDLNQAFTGINTFDGDVSFHKNMNISGIIINDTSPLPKSYFTNVLKSSNNSYKTIYINDSTNDTTDPPIEIKSRLNPVNLISLRDPFNNIKYGVDVFSERAFGGSEIEPWIAERDNDFTTKKYVNDNFINSGGTILDGIGFASNIPNDYTSPYQYLKVGNDNTQPTSGSSVDPAYEYTVINSGSIIGYQFNLEQGLTISAGFSVYQSRIGLKELTPKISPGITTGLIELDEPISVIAGEKINIRAAGYPTGKTSISLTIHEQSELNVLRINSEIVPGNQLSIGDSANRVKNIFTNEINANNIHILNQPLESTHVATKQYVDSKVGTVSNLETIYRYNPYANQGYHKVFEDEYIELYFYWTGASSSYFRQPVYRIKQMPSIYSKWCHNFTYRNLGGVKTNSGIGQYTDTYLPFYANSYSWSLQSGYNFDDYAVMDAEIFPEAESGGNIYDIKFYYGTRDSLCIKIKKHSI
jgi:hypothetical protein